MAQDIEKLLPSLGEYLRAREAARDASIDAKWSALTERERVLVREAAVLAFVHGRQWPDDAAHPKDSVVVRRVLGDSDAMSDLYPALAALDEVEASR